MEWPVNLLEKADFSKETDLKERLRKQLFKGNVTVMPGRRRLEDDEVAFIHAAGDAELLHGVSTKTSDSDDFSEWF